MPKPITPYQSLLNEIITEIEQHRIKAAQDLTHIAAKGPSTVKF